MTLQERVDNYSKVFPDRPPMHTNGRWLEGLWIGGNNYKGSGYYGCLPANVRVLTADLDWVLQGSVQPGDVLLGVTETPAKGKKRRLEPSLVLSVGPVELPSSRIYFHDGTSITASNDHRWLTLQKDGQARWTRTDELVSRSQIRQLCSVWARSDNFDSGWIAGLIDGEGHAEHGSGFRVGISQNEGEVLRRAAKIVTRWGIDVAVQPRGTRAGMFDIRTKHSGAALKLLGMAPTVRLQRSWEGVGLPIKEGGVVKYVELVEPAGVKALVGMETSTKTFIAEGLISHNSYPPDYLERVAALFPDLMTKRLLHLFSGSLTKDAGGIRVDINPAVQPDVAGDARQLPFPNQSFDLILADTPYSEWHATKYGTTMPDRRSVVREAARVTAPGGFLVWLDTKLPMFRKDEWNWLGLAQVLGDGETEDDWIWRGSVQLVRSTNHDYRGSAIFERRGA